MKINEELIKEYKILVKNVFLEEEQKFGMVTVETMDGKYVGDLETAVKLFDKGIVPETDFRDNNVVSIGKSFKDGKWYGWSHRAICGFQIGDVVREGDITAESGWTEEYLKENPDKNLALPVGFEAKTEEDAKRMAIAFADSVS